MNKFSKSFPLYYFCFRGWFGTLLNVENIAYLFSWGNNDIKELFFGEDRQRNSVGVQNTYFSSVSKKIF